MLSKFPELFDRKFAVGYFLPALIFILAMIGLANLLGGSLNLFSPGNATELNVLIETTLIGLLAWVAGIGLVAINRDVIRMMEGYSKINPFRLLLVGKYSPVRPFLTKQHDLYRQIQDQISENNREIQRRKAADEDTPKDLISKKGQLMQKLVEEFPDERYLLPTAFGNILRSAEVYSRIMYGFDIIPGWSRLLSVIPDEYKALIDNAKAQLDFWVNLWLLSLVTLVVFTLSCCAALLGFASFPPALWIALTPVLTIIAAFLGYWRAKSAGKQRGELIKAAVDVYLPDLHKRMGFHPPSSKEDCRKQWERFSQAVIYRLPASMPEQQYYREQSATTTSQEDGDKETEIPSRHEETKESP